MNPLSRLPVKNHQSFLDHLDELRTRLIISVVGVAIFSFGSYFFIEPIMAFVLAPVGQVVFTSPQDAFVARVFLAFICGVLAALPLVLYQAWKFLSVGLHSNESKMIAVYLPASICLFFAGVFFAYFIALPMAIKFLLGFQSPSIIPMITIKNYISFMGTVVIAFGIVFELPLVMIFLARIGIATPAFLVQKRRHAIVLIFIISAILTPPDAVSQIIMAIPMILLYEIGVLAVKLSYRPSQNL